MRFKAGFTRRPQKGFKTVLRPYYDVGSDEK